MSQSAPREVWLTGVESHVEDAPVRLARVVSIDQGAAELLVAAVPAPVRRNLDALTAAQYVIALADLGLMAEVRSAPARVSGEVVTKPTKVAAAPSIAAMEQALDVAPSVDVTANTLNVPPTVDAMAHTLNIAPAVDAMAHTLNGAPTVDALGQTLNLPPEAPKPEAAADPYASLGSIEMPALEMPAFEMPAFEPLEALELPSSTARASDAGVRSAPPGATPDGAGSFTDPPPASADMPLPAMSLRPTMSSSPPPSAVSNPPDTRVSIEEGSIDPTLAAKHGRAAPAGFGREIKLLEIPDEPAGIPSSLLGIVVGVAFLVLRSAFGLSVFAGFSSPGSVMIDALLVALIAFMLFRIGERAAGSKAPNVVRRSMKVLFIAAAVGAPWVFGIGTTSVAQATDEELPARAVGSPDVVARELVGAAGRGDTQTFSALMLGEGERGEAAGSNSPRLLREIGWYRLSRHRDRANFLQLQGKIASQFNEAITYDNARALRADWDSEATEPWYVRVSHPSLEHPIEVTVVRFEGAYRPIDAFPVE